MNATESTESCDQTPTPPPPAPPTQAPSTANQPVAIAITPASQSGQPIQSTATVYHRTTTQQQPMERYVVPIEHVKLEQEMKFQVRGFLQFIFCSICFPFNNF